MCGRHTETKHLIRSFLTFCGAYQPFVLRPVLKYRRISKGEQDRRLLDLSGLRFVLRYPSIPLKKQLSGANDFEDLHRAVSWTIHLATPKAGLTSLRANGYGRLSANVKTLLLRFLYLADAGCFVHQILKMHELSCMFQLLSSFSSFPPEGGNDVDKRLILFRPRNINTRRKGEQSL